MRIGNYRYELIDWQTWWSPWYRLPWVDWYDGDEYGPAELWCGFGPLQMRFYVWRVK